MKKPRGESRTAEPQFVALRDASVAESLQRSIEAKLCERLNPGERGAVVSIVSLGGDVGSGPFVDEYAEAIADLALPLLFFERLSVPSGLAYGLPEDPERDALIGEDIHRCPVSLVNGSDRDHPEFVPFMVYEQLAAREPGGWSIWEGAGQHLVPNEALEAGLGFRLDLQRAFIVPSRDLPLADVVGFRRQYRDDLIALRLHVDDLCAQIAANGYDPAAARTAIERFDAGLARYTRTVSGWNNRKAVADLSISMNWTKAAAAGAAAVLASRVLADRLPQTTAALALAGAAAAGLTVETSAGLKRESANSPFRYFAAIRYQLG